MNEKSLRTKEQALAEVKKLIVEYKLTKGDIRGKAIKQLMGECIKMICYKRLGSFQPYFSFPLAFK